MPFKDQTKQKEYMRQESIKRKNVKHDCPCGGKYTDKHQARHNKTSKHLVYILYLHHVSKSMTSD